MISFVIAVVENQLSLDGALKANRQLCDYGFNSNVFSGTDSKKSLERLAEESRSVDPNAFKLHKNYLNRIQHPGVIGCFFSHMDLWQKCVELNETIFIFEDDVVFKRNFFNVEFTDVLLLSVDFTTYRSVEESLFLQKIRFFLDDPKGQPMSIPYIGNSIQGSSGYSIKPSGARKLLERYKNTYEAVDFCICSLNLDIKIHSYLMGEPKGLKSLTS